MKILLAVDGSEVSLAAVRFAIGMARQGLRSSIVLANVQEPAHLYELVLTTDAEAIARASAAAGDHILQPALDMVRQAGLECECEVAQGDPAHTIVDICERYGCELIVLGAQGRGVLSGALLGSVSNQVIHAAGVPVMIVKSEQDIEPDPGAEIDGDAAA